MKQYLCSLFFTMTLLPIYATTYRYHDTIVTFNDITGVSFKDQTTGQEQAYPYIEVTQYEQSFRLSGCTGFVTLKNRNRFKTYTVQRLEASFYRAGEDTSTWSYIMDAKQIKYLDAITTLQYDTERSFNLKPDAKDSAKLRSLYHDDSSKYNGIRHGRLTVTLEESLAGVGQIMYSYARSAEKNPIRTLCGLGLCIAGAIWMLPKRKDQEREGPTVSKSSRAPRIPNQAKVPQRPHPASLPPKQQARQATPRR